MPRYFFHYHVRDRLTYDRIGVELPDFRLSSDATHTAEVWIDIFAERLQPGRIIVVTDKAGQMVFVTAT